MNKGDMDKAEFDILTMVDTCSAWRNQPSNITCDGVIFDALVLLQFNCTLYKAIAGHRIMRHQSYKELIYFALHSPTSVVTIRGDSTAFKDILQFEAVRKRYKRRY